MSAVMSILDFIQAEERGLIHRPLKPYIGTNHEVDWINFCRVVAILKCSKMRSVVDIHTSYTDVHILLCYIRNAVRVG